MNTETTRICLVPRVSGVGGMVSFRDKFSHALRARGIEVLHDLHRAIRNSHPAPRTSILVIGGTRDLLGLWRAKRHGIKIVQRLNGMNWLHRKLNTGIRHTLKSIYGNWNLQFIRSRLADHIVYQSEFSRRWWERVYCPTKVPNTIVYNGVDLNTYAPDSQSAHSQSPVYRILLVEGSLMGGYELGLGTAVALFDKLNSAYRQKLGKPVELVVVGRVGPDAQTFWSQRADSTINWMGLVPPDSIPDFDRAAHLFYAADINAACPNAVIEALACGTPVLAFGTGALPELVTGDSGRVVPYGGDPWQLESPNVDALAEAAVEILLHQERFRPAARARAEAAFGLDEMVDGYLDALID
jgi:glycosyltransferase involved in cell wall biosynthesis